ncbi:MAG TPA: CNNM domain-containing protein [Planctomycetota bacterium]|jgi:CBS domain containing-hemolysin-like protein/mannitol/fructose-specific phosphotransferase system IIA component (Ntr-type)|nr:CNNM domain-containing protein [Planctomycetota bacterium]
MDLSPLLGLAIALAFVALNAFYVLAEFAIVKVRGTRVQELRAAGNREAVLLATHVLPRLDAYLAVCQIGITVASLGLGWIGEPAAAALVVKGFALFGVVGVRVPPGVSFALAFVLVMAVHVVFGEQIPKILAVAAPTRAALLSVRALRGSYRAFYPFLVALNAAANGLLRLAGFPKQALSETAHSEEELRSLLSSSRDRGVLDPSVFAIIDNAFRFRTRTVTEVMVPRERVAYLALMKPWKENLAGIRTARHTRYPLGATSLDDPVGLIHMKDLLLRGLPLGREPNLMRYRRELLEMAPDTRLERALALMRARGAHLALVRGKDGRVAGIVCLEDIVETVVGRLEDEFDREERTGLVDLLVPAAVVPEFVPAGRSDALACGLAHLRALHPHFDAEGALREVEGREAQISTAIGGGVAVPHAILEDLDRPLLALLRLRGRVPFPAIDGRPVLLAFLFLFPATNPALRPRILGDVAWIVQRGGVVERAAAAASAEDAVAILQRALASRAGAPREARAGVAEERPTTAEGPGPPASAGT